MARWAAAQTHAARRARRATASSADAASASCSSPRRGTSRTRSRPTASCSALAAGNAVLLKPAPEAVATAVELVAPAPRSRHPARRRAARALPRRRRRPPPRHARRRRHRRAHRRVRHRAAVPRLEAAAAADRRDERQERARRHRRRRPRPRDPRPRALGVRARRPEVLGREPRDRRGVGCYDDARFLARLADAVRSVRVGPRDRPRDDDGTGHRAARPASCAAALTAARRRRAWLVEPQPLDDVGPAVEPGRAASACSPARGSTAPSASGRCSA